MNKPDKKDKILLQQLREDTNKLMEKYSKLHTLTQDFLRDEFDGETWLHLRQFDDNLRDALEEIR